MSLFQQLESKLKQALLGHDFVAIDILKLVKSVILLQAKEMNAETPPDQVCQAVIYKQIKAYEDVIALYEGQGRLKAVAQKRQEIEILKALLPAQLSHSDLTKAVDQVIADSNLDLEMRNFKFFLEQIEQKVGLGVGRSQIARILQERMKAGNV